MNRVKYEYKNVEVIKIDKYGIKSVIKKSIKKY